MLGWAREHGRPWHEGEAVQDAPDTWQGEISSHVQALLNLQNLGTGMRDEDQRRLGVVMCETVNGPDRRSAMEELRVIIERACATGGTSG